MSSRDADKKAGRSTSKDMEKGEEEPLIVAENSGSWTLGEILCGVVCTVLSLCLLFTLPVAHIVIGVLYVDQCPAGPLIPLYLMVAGCLGLVLGLLRLVQVLYDTATDKGRTGHGQDGVVVVAEGADRCSGTLSTLNSLLGLFFTTWFITGCVWVYPLVRTVQHEDPDDARTYCQRTCFRFAFWMLNVSVGFAAAALGVWLCAWLLAVLRAALIRYNIRGIPQK